MHNNAWNQVFMAFRESNMKRDEERNIRIYFSPSLAGINQSPRTLRCWLVRPVRTAGFVRIDEHLPMGNNRKRSLDLHTSTSEQIKS